MTNTPNSLDPIAQLVAKYQSNGHQAPPLQQPPAPQQKKNWIGFADKTLWDWISLLLVPLLIGLGTIWVTNQQTYAQNTLNQQLHNSDQRQHTNDLEIAQQQHANDLEIAQQARFDDLLKAYRDGIDTLLLTDGLRTSPSGSDVRRIAHSRTLDILRQVDTNRKTTVIAYLSDLGLVQGGYFDDAGNWHKQESAVSLSNADLNETTLNGANLFGADLFGANLSGANLSGANLSGADIGGANLSGANLSGADIGGANLFGADLFGVNLNRANLFGADLFGVNLNRANLFGADLSGANLNGANLSEANISEANISGADLSGANLFGANLNGANLSGANLSTTLNITPEQLLQVASLSGALMPNGIKHA